MERGEGWRCGERRVGNGGEGLNCGERSAGWSMERAGSRSEIRCNVNWNENKTRNRPVYSCYIVHGHRGKEG